MFSLSPSAWKLLEKGGASAKVRLWERNTELGFLGHYKKKESCEKGRSPVIHKERIIKGVKEEYAHAGTGAQGCCVVPYVPVL